jgi:hypothetical protein
MNFPVKLPLGSMQLCLDFTGQNLVCEHRNETLDRGIHSLAKGIRKNDECEKQVMFHCGVRPLSHDGQEVMACVTTKNLWASAGTHILNDWILIMLNVIGARLIRS